MPQAKFKPNVSHFVYIRASLYSPETHESLAKVGHVVPNAFSFLISPLLPFVTELLPFGLLTLLSFTFLEDHTAKRQTSALRQAKWQEGETSAGRLFT